MREVVIVVLDRLTRLSKRFRGSRPPSRAQDRKVFGIGTIKTGTTSLGEALALLGYRHTHENRNHLLGCVERGELEPVFEWVDRYDSFEDWPWPLLYRELDARYPESQFVLTIRRDDQAWLRSVLAHSDWAGPSKGRRMFFGHSSPFGHEDDYVAVYNRHIESVRTHFAGRPGKLLELCWEKRHGWDELCAFLGKPRPEAEFPWANSAGKRVDK